MILDPSQTTSIIAHRLEGNGLRRTARLVGVDRKTVARWSLLVGVGCQRLLDRRLRNLHPHKLQLDEIHTFVCTRQRRLEPGAAPDHGDCWAYFALCETSRAVVCYLVGKRTLQSTMRFVAELRARVVGRVSVCSDGYPAYLTAIARSFGDDVDYVQLIKEYETVTTASGRRLPDAFVRASFKRIIGAAVGGSSTSYVERFNATLRHQISKFARLSYEHAKSRAPLVADVALLTAAYNFQRVHNTLKTTPAVALGIEPRPWSIDQLVDAALAEPEPDPLALPKWVALEVRPSSVPPVPPTVEAGYEAFAEEPEIHDSLLELRGLW